MFLPLKHKVNALVALLFSAVLLGSLLVKPLHILLVSHDRAETLEVHTESRAVSTPQHDCTICNFEFCFFIPQAQVYVPKADITFAVEITPRTIERTIQQTSHHFLLRGPPTLNT